MIFCLVPSLLLIRKLHTEFYLGAPQATVFCVLKLFDKENDGFAKKSLIQERWLREYIHMLYANDYLFFL